MTENNGIDSLVGARPIRRRRTLPGGRAVVGALLVVGSAMAVFAAFLAATAPPRDAWLVAAHDIAPGHVMAAQDFETIAADLPVAQQATVLRGFQLDQAVGTVAAASIQQGSFIVATMVADRSRVSGELVSFALPRERALAGDVGPGSVVDIVASFGGTGEVVTEYVVRGIEVTAREHLGGGVGAGAVLITVRVPDPFAVQALLHAVGNATVYLVSPGAGDTIPPAYSRSVR